MNKFIVLIFLVFTNQAFADFWDFLRPTPKVPNHAVEDHHIDQANCLTERYYRYGRDSIYEKYFDSLVEGHPKKNIRIQGKDYIEDYVVYEDLYRFLTGHRSIRKDDACTTIKCELISLFGESYLHKLVYLKEHFFFNASYIAHRKGNQFSEKELDLILWSFEQLPRFMFHNRMKLMIKDMKQYTGLYATVVGFMEKGTGNMTLFKKWAQSTDETKIYTVIHEFGHFIGEKLGIHDSRKWIQMSGWDKVEDGKVNKSDQLISVYARSNYLEDFAETFSAYRMNPSLLKEKSPKKYKMMKELVFLGIDYYKQSCESKLVIKNHQFDNIITNEVVDKCEYPIVAFKLKLKDISNVISCLSDNKKLYSIDQFFSENNTYQKSVINNFNVRKYPYLPQYKRNEFSDVLLETIKNSQL